MRAGEGKLPGHTLALSMARVWEAIREQRDLNLPAHKVRPLRRHCARGPHSRRLCMGRGATCLALERICCCMELGLYTRKKSEREKCADGAGDGGQHPLRGVAGGAAALAGLRQRLDGPG